MNDTQRDDLWDRLTDLALREAVGGKRPQESEAQVGNPIGDQVGNQIRHIEIGDIMPASRVASAPGAAGKGKRPASADRASWTRPEDGPRRSTLRVLVVSTCLLVGLTLVIVINRAAGDRPWLWPVAKEDGGKLSSPYYIYDDVQYIPKGNHHFDSLVDSISSTVKPDSWKEAGGRSKLVFGTFEGELRGGSKVGGGEKRKEHFSEIEEYYDGTASAGLQGQGAGYAGQRPTPGVGHGIAGTGEVSRSGDGRERLGKLLNSTKKLIKDETDVEDSTPFNSRTPEQRPDAPAPRPEPVVADPFSAPPAKTLTDGTSATILNAEVDEKVIAELSKLRAEAVNETRVALAVRVVTGKEAGPEVIRGFLEKSKDGRGVGPGQGGDRYQPINENRFQGVGNNPLSTFSIDVDTASYSKVRRLLFQHHELPPPDAVRLEEFINYHVYHYAGPEDGPVGADSRRRNAIVGSDSGRRNSATEAGPVPGPSATGAASSATGVASYKARKAASEGAAKNHPFAVHGDVAACPWQPGHKLLRIAIKGREIKNEDRPPSNLVFLVDVSGSMDEPDRLPLVKKGLKNLVQRLRATDRVAIVVYAGDAGLVLPSTPGNEKVKIMSVLDELKPQGSTNGAQGIHLAYDIAAQNFIRGGTNRVMLATDGDFNVGTTSDAELVRLVEKRAKEKVFLTTLGVGIGNHNDAMLQQIADKGNGQCFYLDSELEADKVLVQQIGGTLVTIAKDVKIQVEFNPAKVAAYRLLGYEKRMLRTEDFADDTKDAGEIGAGHTVTALYEIVPVPAAKGPLEAPPVAEEEPTALKYQKPAELTAAAQSAELLTVHMRYKQPEADKSEPLDIAVNDAEVAFAKAPGDFQFAAAVASFAMILRNSQYRGETSYDKVIELAAAGLKDDEPGYRAEFVEMVKRAKEIAEGRKPSADKK